MNFVNPKEEKYEKESVGGGFCVLYAGTAAHGLRRKRIEQHRRRCSRPGEWQQVNSNAEDSYQTATITDDTITVNWVAPDTTALYWAGSFEAPTTADEPYTWDSVNDTEQTANALLASSDETKTFTYEDGQISYSVSAMGVTTTGKLEKK